MSFITKRERVFNEYDPFDIPPRNEGKLKAYASCTDTRAWSHFCTDKTEHLVEIIKRNNDLARSSKYVPINVIIDTLLAQKKAEIARLKRKIEEFEQMLAAYEDLDLTCEQKCEIAKAHAAIKAANKDLDDLYLDLDTSGFTEGIDSEAFETGNSRGDGASGARSQMGGGKGTAGESQVGSAQGMGGGSQMGGSQGMGAASQMGGGQGSAAVSQMGSGQGTASATAMGGDQGTTGVSQMAGGQGKNAGEDDEDACYCVDASTNATDPRVEEMKDTIIAKDAKLNAMNNTIAVMENDICEPYCIYAHIYTALEKIFGILCQNRKYKMYLEQMTCGKDCSCVDIKGKILYKLKVFEKFCVALIAPCSQNSVPCYRAEVIPPYALEPADSKKPSLDNKRAHLVADIMQNDEMADILCKDCGPTKSDYEFEDYAIENYDYDIETENLKRLKKLQENYDDLMNCYESLKNEKDCLIVSCRNYEHLEKEYENLKCQLREYNALWNEKEHYRKRSVDLDALKEQFLILSNETTNLETQLKAESEINKIKTKTIEELRNENVMLEKKLNEALIAFEKEKNALQCKLKECECKEMCQEQQIKTLAVQIDRLLEQDTEKIDVKPDDFALIDEINAQKEQIKNLKELLFGTEEEKQQLQEEYHKKLSVINDLRMEIEDWKSTYEKTLQHNEYLQKYTDDFKDEFQKLIDNNNVLTHDVEEKSIAIENLLNVINKKSEEVNKLMESLEKKNKENNDMYEQIQYLQENYQKNLSYLDEQKHEAMTSLQLARQESQELLEKVRSITDKKEEQIANSLKIKEEEHKKLKELLSNTQEENKNLLLHIKHSDTEMLNLQKEIERLRDMNKNSASNIVTLQEQIKNCNFSLQLSRKESQILEEKTRLFDELSKQLQNLQESHKVLINEKERLENELQSKNLELADAEKSIELTKAHSDDLMDILNESQNVKSDIIIMQEAYDKLINEKEALLKQLTNKKDKLDNLLQSFNDLKVQNEQKSNEVENLSLELYSLKKLYERLLNDNASFEIQIKNKSDEINDLKQQLETKTEENKNLQKQLQSLQHNHQTVSSEINLLKERHSSTNNILTSLQKNSNELLNKVKHYESMESDYKKLKDDLKKTKLENNKLQRDLETQQSDLKRMKRENTGLNNESQYLLRHSEDLAKALINARTQLLDPTASSSSDNYATIIKEIKDMKLEKDRNLKKIKDLLEKLDESENIISSLSEDLDSRNDHIKLLKQHMNNLEDEVRKLQHNLAVALETGEDIDNHSRKISDSLQSMTAHHSKATHNMKVAKLQNDNNKLVKQMSDMKVRSDEFDQDLQRYVSQINELQNERVTIISDIKELEMQSVGDSALTVNNCDIDAILSSLDRIRKSLDARHTKSSSLEQTLLKVQNSYHLVQSKADEAKKIVEKEKQKIISEKEEAIKDKINMEKQLNDLKRQLETQISQDKAIIKDLEAELLNQKLLSDKFDKSRQSYIQKLEEEMKSLQSLYDNSLTNAAQLEKKIISISNEHSKDVGVIDQMTKELREKYKELDALRKELEKLKNPTYHSKYIQVDHQNISLRNKKDIACQTDNELEYQHFIRYEVDKNDSQDSNLRYLNKHDSNKHQRNSKPLKEVQVLTAKVENTLLDQRLHQLSTKHLEQFSLSGSSDYEGTSRNEGFYNEETQGKRAKKYIGSEKTKTDVPVSETDKLILDIYNKQSMHTNSSKAMNSDDIDNEPRDAGKINTKKADHRLSNNNEDFNMKSEALFGSLSEDSTNKDLFVIYSESTNSNERKPENNIWANAQSEILVESVLVQKQRQNENKQRDRKDIYPEEIVDDNIVKQKLENNLPRVKTKPDTTNTSAINKTLLDLSSIATSFSVKDKTFTEHKESIANLQTKQDSSLTRLTPESTNKHANVGIKPIQKSAKQSYVSPSDRTEVPSDKNISIITSGYLTPVSESLIVKNDESHYRLSHVDADAFLTNTETEQVTYRTLKEQYRSKRQNHALDYILDSAKQQNNPENIKTYNAAKSLRRVKSDEQYNMLKAHGESDSNINNTNNYKNSSIDRTLKMEHCQNNVSENIENKYFTEQGVLVKLDAVDDYEKKIERLSITLQSLETDYKKKIDAIKTQYDNNIKSIINEHNQGVNSIQSLHEETLQDIIKMHENEVENWRSMSIEAMRKADILEKENRSLKIKMLDQNSELDEELLTPSPSELRKHKKVHKDPNKMLTKTTVEAFNVKPKNRSNGPCTCSLDINISDTIRNILEQVDIDQRKMAENTYLKYIANKLMTGNVETLDTQELSFLHFKVCRMWKLKINKEETLQKKIDSLESELLSKQKHAQQDIAELDRRVAEERLRLQEVREAVCRTIPTMSRYDKPVLDKPLPTSQPQNYQMPTVLKEFMNNCQCQTANCKVEICERQSMTNLTEARHSSSIPPSVGARPKRSTRPDIHRVCLSKFDNDERRDKKLYPDELPTRLRKATDRLARPKKL